MADECFSHALVAEWAELHGFSYGRYPFPSVCYVPGVTHPGDYRNSSPAFRMSYDLTAASVSYYGE
jgi:hypothetical protein